jgi:hypothetical protein
MNFIGINIILYKNIETRKTFHVPNMALDPGGHVVVLRGSFVEMVLFCKQLYSSRF